MIVGTVILPEDILKEKYMNDVTDLYEEKRILEDRLKKVDIAIRAMQSLCYHKKPDGTSAMVFSGNDSHKDYYKCSLCGFEDWE
jgi:peptide subunit release factor 1 (eRF1)